MSKYLDISNYTINDISNLSEILNADITDIGMLYCDIEVIQEVANYIATSIIPTQTVNIYYQDADITNYVEVDNIELVEYKENEIEIVLNSPLLEGDTIEVVDGVLSHVHKMSKVVLDGSEDGWTKTGYDTVAQGWDCCAFWLNNQNYILKNETTVNEVADIISDRFITSSYHCFTINLEGVAMTCDTNREVEYIAISIKHSSLKSIDVDGFKAWLQANPTTVVYELAESWVENIEPLQSQLTLATFKNSNLTFNSALPIKSNITWSHVVPSTYVLSRRTEEVQNSELVTTSLLGIIDEEVDSE